MTSKLTRERIELIANFHRAMTLPPSHDEIEELARMAMVAMDSEPVAWSNGCNKSVPAALRYLAEKPRTIGGESSFNTAHLYQLAREIEFMAEAPLYRHAQQSVVPDRSIFEKWWESQNGAPLDGWDSLRATDGYCDDGIDGQFEAWNACRAAMLQGAKNSESRCGIQTAPALDSFKKNADARCGNSPVIPEGYVMVPKEPTAQMYDAGDRQMTTKQVWDAMLAVATQEAK